MKIVVDQRKCQTVGICVQLCPEVFRFQEGSKKAVALENDIPLRYLDACIEAIEKCPSGAISLQE
ncbi:MAG TPA: ferredoxin [Deltaproteobacteria bacterium]|nr:ferredoxin [Deltaproteobacteria bacterium]